MIRILNPQGRPLEISRQLLAFAVGLGLFASVLTGIAVTAKASTVTVPLPSGIAAEISLSGDEAAGIVKVAHPRRARKARRGSAKRTFRRHHRKFHRRYSPGKPRFRRAHRRFHRHYKRRHRGPTIYFGVYPRYYDPYYYRPNYYDPYYYGPSYSARLGCRRVMRILRRLGYRRIRSINCTGKIYWFNASSGGRRYKLRVSAYSGQILKRYRR